MASNKEALQERYQRFSQGDIEGALDIWTDDFVWDGAEASELPGAARHEGKPAAVAVLQQAVGAWDSFELTADEFFEDGDTVIVLGHTDVTRGTSRLSCPWCTSGVRAADEVCRLQILTDTLASARALGVV